MSLRVTLLASLPLIMLMCASGMAQPYQEAGGLVVVEGENYFTADGRTDENGYQWRVSTEHEGYVGAGYADTPGPQGTNGTWENACEITFDIEFTTPGTYSVWVRRYSLGGASNSVWVGLDGVGNGANDNTEDHNQWIWKSLGTLDVTAGLHVLNVRRREAAFSVDRIVLTTDGAFVPTGEGPAETLRKSPTLAGDASPADEAVDVPREIMLEWSAGVFAVTHDVYLGTVFDDVNNADRGDTRGVLVSQGQSATAYAPPTRLEFGQVYYWRIDEVNAAPDNTVFKGEVWSFTVELLAYPIQNVTATSNASFDPGSGPERMVDGSGLNERDEHSTASGDMSLVTPAGADPVQFQFEFDRVYKLHELLVWNYNVMFEPILGFGLKDVAVEYSENGTNWTMLGDVEFAQATARADYVANTTVEFAGAAAQYVRLTVNSGFGMIGQLGLSEVRFLYIPAHAREPEPSAGAMAVPVDSALAWRPGREAVTHDVYLGTSPEDLVLVDSVGAPSYTPGALEFAGTYYWKIDEVNEAEAISVWQGDIWEFATQEYAVIDDMEAYDDEDNRIYDAWLDGWVNDTGSTVGYLEEPFAEQAVVNSGRQSMPLQYDNSAAPFYSEAERDLGGMNLAANGADTLRLFVAGLAPGFLETGDGTILMNAIGTDIWGTSDQFRFAYKSLTGNGSLVARIDSLDVTPDVWVKAGVMIRQGTGTGSQHSFMPITGSGGGGASWQGRVDTGQASVNQDNAGVPVAVPYWVRIDRSGNSFTGFISPGGETWTQIGDPREVVMTDPVLIGMALTSHNANQATSAQFSGVSFTGNVTGAWQVAEIGATQPEGNRPL